MPEREVRYCTTEDGVRIAYSVQGEGPALVVLPGFVEQFSSWPVPSPKRWAGAVIRFDGRGIGYPSGMSLRATHPA